MHNPSSQPPHEALPAHVAENRRHWDVVAPEWVAAGERCWAQAEPDWGIWGVPESELRLLPDDMAGMDAVELGCGTGFVSAWMARRGARVTGIDNSAQQLATAQRLAQQHGVSLTLVHGDAERTPFADASFDFAISEYGAAIWCEPNAWLREAHRILRPTGRLVFLGHHPLSQVCSPEDGGEVTRRLERSYFDLSRLDWSTAQINPGGVEFNLSISAWFALFERVGFAVEGFLEPRPASGAGQAKFSVSPAWARDHPSEQVWKLRKR